MAGFLDRLRGLGARQPAKPFKEQGVSGYAVTGGQVVSMETNPSLAGPNRWRVASDMLANVSVVAASLRYMLNLVARPAWQVEPSIEDNDAAKQMAEFVNDIIHDTDTSWSRIVRRMAMYRFHGYGIAEWVAKQREDGKIGIASIEQRPAHTIEKWDIDFNGGVIGVWQRAPQDGQEIYLPRQKLIYLVDDALTDRPDGMGWWRHMVEPANRIAAYLKLEGIGFQRDLAGVPIGRAPLHKINDMVEAGDITKEQGDEMIRGLKDFVRLETKGDKTGLILDSQTFIAKGDTGDTVSAIKEWDLELIKSEQGSIDALAAGIKRLEYQMALVMGTASMLTGREGEGSRALAEDQSRNLYLTVNATLADMAEAFDRDIIGPLWAMNGFDDKLRPTLKTEDASFKDVEQVARVLMDMASAGAILAPDDPAIQDVRDLLGLSRARELSIDELTLIRSGKRPEDPNATDLAEGDQQDPQNPKGGRGRAAKYDPSQPRDYHGRWSDGAAGAIPFNSDTKASLLAPNQGKDLDKLLAEAKTNQAELGRIGLAVEDNHDGEFVDPGPKTKESALRKVSNEGYDSAAHLTDLARGSFVVDSPEEADTVVHEISKHATVYDKGWVKLSNTGYLDRKLYVQFKNGGVAEIQLVPRGIQQLKMGTGHRLYEVMRDVRHPLPVRKSTARRSRTLYAKALAHSPFEQIAVRA